MASLTTRSATSRVAKFATGSRPVANDNVSVCRVGPTLWDYDLVEVVGFLYWGVVKRSEVDRNSSMTGQPRIEIYLSRYFIWDTTVIYVFRVLPPELATILRSLHFGLSSRYLA
jgi:hypothetical protein